MERWLWSMEVQPQSTIARRRSDGVSIAFPVEASGPSAEAEQDFNHLIWQWLKHVT
jgi:hypothetical protein